MKKTESSVWYVVLLVAVLTVIAFVSERNWKALAFFALATAATYAIKRDKLWALVTGIITSNVFKAVMGSSEGFEGKEEDEKTMDDEVKGPKPAVEKKKKDSTLEDALDGSSLDGLMKRQTELTDNLKKLEPLMMQAKDMMKVIPPDMMKKAMSDFMK
jgi:hypothetical protein